MKTLAKLPATIVTGFLGSGKTTLLRHILANANGRRIAVIVNEFGELGIDGDILRGAASAARTRPARSGQLYELANGCMCCTVQEEFYPVMRELIERRDEIDHILIETSGLALPKPLVQAFNWPEIKNACTVDAVITVVDVPATAAGQLAANPAAVDAQRKLDPNLDHESPLHELFEDQLTCADLVILTKPDQASADERAQVEANVRRGTAGAGEVIVAPAMADLTWTWCWAWSCRGRGASSTLRGATTTTEEERPPPPRSRRLRFDLGRAAAGR